MMIADLNKSSFLRKLATVPRGQWLMYHVGFLYQDRLKSHSLAMLANAIYAEYEKGTVCLVQHKLGDMMYQYFAVKR